MDDMVLKADHPVPKTIKIIFECCWPRTSIAEDFSRISVTMRPFKDSVMEESIEICLDEVATSNVPALANFRGADPLLGSVRGKEHLRVLLSDSKAKFFSY